MSAVKSYKFVYVLFTENHILEDVNKCVIALQEGDVDTLDRTAGAIRGRAARVIHIINAEMENYEAGVYTEKVLEATKLLSETGNMEIRMDQNVNIMLNFHIRIHLFHCFYSPCI